MEYWPIQSGNQTSQKSPMEIRVYSWENQRTKWGDLSLLCLTTRGNLKKKGTDLHKVDVTDM